MIGGAVLDSAADGVDGDGAGHRRRLAATPARRLERLIAHAGEVARELYART